MTTDNMRRVEIADRLVGTVAGLSCSGGAAVWSAYWISAAWREGPRAHYANDAVLVTAAGFALLMVLLLDKHGDYRPCLSLLAVRETERLLRVTIAGFLLALPILLAVTKTIPRTAIALALVMVPLLLALEKWQTHAAIQIDAAPGSPHAQGGDPGDRGHGTQYFLDAGAVAEIRTRSGGVRRG